MIPFSMFADLRASAATEEPHTSLTRFFTLRRLIDRPSAADLDHPGLPSPQAPAGEVDVDKPGSGPTPSTSNPRSPELDDDLRWVAGDGAREILDLKAVLLKESQEWFFTFMEGALVSGFHAKRDGLGAAGAQSKEASPARLAATLSQLKRSNDWLEQLPDAGGREDEGLLERIDKLKKMIYACLLGHVDSAAAALGSRTSN